MGRLRETYHRDVPVVESEVCIGHLVILKRNHANHDREERHGRKLHGQQTELPSAPALAVVSERRRDRNPVEEMCRQSGVYEDERDDYGYGQNQRLSGEERRNVGSENLLHGASECKDEDCCESAAKQRVDESFREHHPEHLASSASEAFPQSHLAAARHRRRKDYKQIVQHRGEQQRECHEPKQQRHVSLILVLVVESEKRLDDEILFKSGGLHLLHRKVGVYESSEIAVEPVGVGGLPELQECAVTVIADDPVRSVIDEHSCGRNRDEHLRTNA